MEINDNKDPRLFFALWPDEKIRQQIVNRRISIQFRGDGRPVKTENLHLTLAYLGNVNPDQQSCAQQMADKVRGAPFTVCIDTTGYWHKPRIIWIGPRTMPGRLVTLATALRNGAHNCGIKMYMRPYNAHVTLMRKVAKQTIDEKITPLNWQVRNFVLVKSTSTADGLIYDVINEWPLSAAGKQI